MHEALLPLKCCSPLSETYRSIGGHPVTAVAQRIGGGESLTKGGRDWRTELRGKPGSHEQRSVYKLKLCGQERRRSLPGEYYWLAWLENIFNPQMLAFWLGYLLNELRDCSGFFFFFVFCFHFLDERIEGADGFRWREKILPHKGAHINTPVAWWWWRYCSLRSLNGLLFEKGI